MDKARTVASSKHSNRSPKKSNLIARRSGLMCVAEQRVCRSEEVCVMIMPKQINVCYQNRSKRHSVVWKDKLID